jgi:hypothetical protein
VPIKHRRQPTTEIVNHRRHYGVDAQLVCDIDRLDGAPAGWTAIPMCGNPIRP